MSLQQRMNDFEFEVVSSSAKAAKEEKPEKELKILTKEADAILKELGL